MTIKVYVNRYFCKVSLFAFNELTNMFTVNSTKTTTTCKFSNNPGWRETKNVQTIDNIKSYKFIKNGIILQEINGAAWICNNFAGHTFSKFPNIEHKLYIYNKIYIEHNNVLYNTTTKVSNIEILTKDKIVMNLPTNIFYRYDPPRYNIIVNILDNNLYINNGIIDELGASKYIATVELSRDVCILFSNKVVVIVKTLRELYAIVVPLKRDVIDDEVITHGICSRFVWTPTTHHYLSTIKKEVINTIILCNKHTKYQRISRFILHDTIRLLY